jgi:hypothetical protein
MMIAQYGKGSRLDAATQNFAHHRALNGSSSARLTVRDPLVIKSTSSTRSAVAAGMLR